MKATSLVFVAILASTAFVRSQDEPAAVSRESAPVRAARPMTEGQAFCPDIVTVLRENFGGDNREAFERYKFLLNTGKDVYPALEVELFSTKDALMISAITGFFEQSKGDKSIPLRALRRFLEIHGRENPPRSGIRDVIMALGQLGGDAEKKALQGYLDLDDIRARTIIRDNIERIEKRLRNVELQALSEKRRVKQNPARSIRSQSGKQLGANDDDFETFNSERTRLYWIVGAVVAIVAAILVRRLKHATGSVPNGTD